MSQSGGLNTGSWTNLAIWWEGRDAERATDEPSGLEFTPFSSLPLSLAIFFAFASPFARIQGTLACVDRYTPQHPSIEPFVNFDLKVRGLQNQNRCR